MLVTQALPSWVWKKVVGWYLLLPSSSQIAVIVGVPGLRCMHRSRAIGAGHADDRSEFGICDLEDLGVIGRVGQLHLMQHRVAAEPLQVLPVLRKDRGRSGDGPRRTALDSSRHFSGPGFAFVRSSAISAPSALPSARLSGNDAAIARKSA